MFEPFIFLFLFLIAPLLITLIANHEQKSPPGPPSLPFIGNLLHMDKSKPGHVYLRDHVSNKYGPVALLRHGSTPVLLVSSSKMAAQVLGTHDLSFCSRPPVAGQQKLSYGGIDMAFSPYNHHWKELRKICVHRIFSPKSLLSFRSIREDEVSRMVDRVSTITSSSSSSSSVINLSSMAMSLAVNLICRAAFGRRYEDDEYERIRFDRLIMEAQALMVSFYACDHFPPSPFTRWIDKARGLTNRLEKNFEELDAFYQQIINEHLVDPYTQPSKEQRQDYDIVDFMISFMKEQKDSSSSLNLTWNHIKALLMNLFVAGTDTVAAAVVWAMTSLMLNPSVMKKAQTHIRGTIGAKGVVDEDDPKKLPYLRAVVLETLRLYPPAPLIFRTQQTEFECMVGGFKVSAGTSVIINGWAIARDPETWENAEEFIPERFMQNEYMHMMNKFQMIPFGGGRRGCPGMAMGLLSTQLVLANLLYLFNWTQPQTLDTDSLPGLTTHKKNPLLLVPTKYVI